MISLRSEKLPDVSSPSCLNISNVYRDYFIIYEASNAIYSDDRYDEFCDQNMHLRRFLSAVLRKDAVQDSASLGSFACRCNRSLCGTVAEGCVVGCYGSYCNQLLDCSPCIKRRGIG